MPFNVWCDGCGNHVGMGVRYNAEKKKVGMYYTTPIYEFRMKCHLCTNHFVIRTDPQKFDYELVSGLRRQERRWDMSENEQVASTEGVTARKLATDAMFKLEHGELDLAKLKAAEPQVERLEKLQKRWKDDFSRNQELRQIFRKERKRIKSQKETDKALLAKSSLNIDLVPENNEDQKLASLMVHTRTVQDTEENLEKNLNEMDRKSVFSSASTSSNNSHRRTASSNPQQRKRDTLAELRKSVIYSIEQKKVIKLDRELDASVGDLSKCIRHDLDHSMVDASTSMDCDCDEVPSTTSVTQRRSTCDSGSGHCGSPVQATACDGLSILKSYDGSSSGSELSDVV